MRRRSSGPGFSADAQQPARRRPATPSTFSPQPCSPAQTHAALGPQPVPWRSAPEARRADAQETSCLGPGSWRADRPPARVRLRTGAPSCGPHTSHPAAASELRALRPSPSRALNFGSPATLREAAEPAPWPQPGPRRPRRVWGKRESRCSLRRCKERDTGPQAIISTPRLPPGLGAGPAHGKTSCFRSGSRVKDIETYLISCYLSKSSGHR